MFVQKPGVNLLEIVKNKTTLLYVNADLKVMDNRNASSDGTIFNM